MSDVMSASDDKNEFIDKFSSDLDLPLYFMPWWLDAVAGKNGWGVSVSRSNSKIVGVLPYKISKRRGLIVISAPKFTQFLGVFFIEGESGGNLSESKKNSIVDDLISRLPAHHVFSQCFEGSFDNWLPLYWKGFEQTTKYSYVLSDLSSIDTTWKGLSGNIRTDIRKAKKSLEVVRDLPVEELYLIMELTYARQGQHPPYSLSEMKHVVEEAVSRKKGTMMFAIDKSGRVHAAAFIAWDSKTAYYLLGGGDPELRRSGAGSLCVWSAIEQASKAGLSFDFEGSMVAPIEKFFRAFGAKRKPYFRLAKFRYGILSCLYGYRRYKTRLL